MAHLGPVAWPPRPIKTLRLVLRESEARDRAGLIELFSSPDVGTYIGGAQPREELERTVPETPGRRAGFFVVELDGTMIGIVTFDRRDAEHPGHIRPEADEAELGYMFLPHVGTRICHRSVCRGTPMGRQRPPPASRWSSALRAPTTDQGASRRSTGFTEAERFEEYGAEQWFAVWSATTATT